MVTFEDHIKGLPTDALATLLFDLQVNAELAEQACSYCKCSRACHEFGEYDSSACLEAYKTLLKAPYVPLKEEATG